MDHTQGTCQRFHQKCLRLILTIKWQTYTPDATVFGKAKCPNIESFIVLNQLRWFGHLVHMEDNRIPKQLFYGELVNGKRPRQKPKKRYKDCLKYNFKEPDIDYNNWEVSAMYRSEWRKTVRDGCSLRLRKMEDQSSKRNYVKDVLKIYQVALQAGYVKLVAKYFIPKLVT